MISERYPLLSIVQRLSIIAVLLLLALLFPLLAGQVLPEGDLIAFMYSNEPTSLGVYRYNWDIYLLDVRTGLSIGLTNYPQWERYPAWSPDGKQIAFHSNVAGTHDLYLMNADGSDITPLNIAPRAEYYDEAMVSWSPDGSYIAFHSGFEASSSPEQFDIYVSGRNVNSIRRVAPASGVSYATDWSPDGLKLVFASDRDRRGTSPYTFFPTSIYVVDLSGGFDIRLVADGLQSVRLTHENVDECSTFPAWSPDGTMIAFDRRQCSSPVGDIYVMDADGGSLRRLAGSSPYDDTHPEWLPDGKRILFASDRGGSYDLYIMDVDGSNVRRLTNLPGDAMAPDWRPR